MWDLFWIRARRQRRLDEKARREGRLFNITVGTGVADFRPVSGVSSVRVECYGAGGSGGSVEPDPTHGKPGAVVIHHPKGCNKFRSPGGCWWTCPEDVFTATVEVQGAGEDGQSGRGGAVETTIGRRSARSQVPTTSFGSGSASRARCLNPRTAS